MPRATRFALDSVRRCATPRSRSRPTRHSSTRWWQHRRGAKSSVRPRGQAQAKNGRRVTAPVTGCGCRRGKAFEGCCVGGTPALPEASPEATAALARNPANPRSGTEMQQARNRCVEEAVEAVQNREDGTRCRGGSAARSLHAARRARAEWTHIGSSEEGNPEDNPMEGWIATCAIRPGAGRAGGEVKVWRRPIDPARIGGRPAGNP